jgi:hypothetical protein
MLCWLLVTSAPDLSGTLSLLSLQQQQQQQQQRLALLAAAWPLP